MTSRQEKTGTELEDAATKPNWPVLLEEYAALEAQYPHVRDEADNLRLDELRMILLRQLARE